MPSSLIGSDLGVLADGSGHGSVAVADMDSNAQTMDWLLNTEIQDPAGESDMGEDLSVAAGSDTLSDDLVEVPDVSQSDPADADPSPEPVPASTVSRPDPVWAVSTPDSAPVRVAPGMAPALVIVAHLPDPYSVSVSHVELSDDVDQGDVVYLRVWVQSLLGLGDMSNLLIDSFVRCQHKKLRMFHLQVLL